jgi:hypothetical protein
MRRLILGMTVLTLLMGGVGQAKAGIIGSGGSSGSAGSGPGGPDPMYTFTFSDLAGDAGFGTLNAMDSGLGDGSLLATSGSLTVTSGGAVGTYSLIPKGPSPENSPSGLFIVDDLIYPNNNAASGVNPGISVNPSYLTNSGLLFGPPGSGTQDEVNFWGNGGGDYAFGAETGGNYTILQFGGGTFTLEEAASAVPEPTTLTMLGIGIASMAGYGWRRRKQPVTA